MKEKLTAVDCKFFKIINPGERISLNEKGVGLGITQSKDFFLATSSVSSQPVCILQVTDRLLSIPTQHPPVILSKEDIEKMAQAVGLLPSVNQE